MNHPTSRQDEAATPPSNDPETGRPRTALEAVRRKLEEHSALEDLGPLFGPEAQGRRQS